MKGSVFIIGAALVLAQPALADTPDIADGEVLYAENCASCHGAELQGQPDWRAPGPDGRLPAPPHDETGHTWHHSDRVLFGYTKLGGKVFMEQQEESDLTKLRFAGRPDQNESAIPAG
ncbi:MAG: cytochrome c, partial [Pseudomonadota bacterium]|nr:cytochrome c [Pseudomonadota bacterium]